MPMPVVQRVSAACKWTLPAVLAVLAVVGAVVWARGDFTTRNHVFFSVIASLVAFVLVGAVAGPTGIQRFTRSGQTTGRVALIGASISATAILAWGLALTAAHYWSLFVPGIVVIALATGVLVAVLLSFEAVDSTRTLLDDIDRRRR